MLYLCLLPNLSSSFIFPQLRRPPNSSPFSSMLSTQSHKYEPLQDGEDLPGEGPPSINTNIWRRRFYVLLSISTLTTTILCGVVAWLLVSLNRGPKIDVKVPYCKRHRQSIPSCADDTTAPASLELRYENRYLTQDPDTPSFMGRPRPEMDQAWHDLLEGTGASMLCYQCFLNDPPGTLIRYSHDELRLAGNASSVAHRQGGYVGGLGISHSLHCLVSICRFDP